MNTLLFLFLRRMRMPLLVLLGAYAISIGGLVLMPGTDDQGNPWRFDFFHAFYFVSFMGSTIGFGEIPYAFSNAQRFWVLVSIYLTVISWLYAIGTILALVQDPAFRRVLTEQRFTRRVRHLRDPFYLIVGYGDTGSLLVAALSRRNIQCVVIDIDPGRINTLSLENLNFDVPSLCCDAREARHLQEAGLEHPCCIGVIALTDVENINVKVAITAKLLRPDLPVICRAETQSTSANLASFNTDHIVNPFRVFADHLTIALRAPSVHLLYKWLISVPGRPLPEPIRPPRGTWIVCGFGRFGRAVNRYLEYEGIPTVIIEPNPQQAPEGAVVGRGTEAVTLREAGIDKAAGLVAGADSDINNLSIIMTAKELNPSLYGVARQNRRANDAVFDAAPADLVMQASRIIVWRILPLLTTPLLGRFLRLARHRHEHWAQQLLELLEPVCDGLTPHVWGIRLDTHQAPAVCAVLRRGETLRLGQLSLDPLDRDRRLPCLALLHRREEQEGVLPADDLVLKQDDELLFCNRCDGFERMQWVFFNRNVLTYLTTGEARPDGYIWRWLARRRPRPAT